MKNCWRFAIPTLIVLTCLAATVEAETRYISDQLVVSLREQPQKGAQLITYLKTGMAVEILEEDGEYIKVQTEAGEIGYIKQNCNPGTELIDILPARPTGPGKHKAKLIFRNLYAITNIQHSRP